MASKNVISKGTTYNGVESITLPTSPSGSATFYEISDTTAVASDVLNSKWFYASDGTYTQGTGTGGGGGQYAWLGNGAEKVGTVFNRTINLANDTSYDSWTASTTAETILSESAGSDYSLAADLINYDYCLVTKGYVEPVYYSETPATYRTYRVVQYHVQCYYGYPSSSSTAEWQTDTANTQLGLGSASTLGVQYYYNNAGVITARTGTQCGPIYMSSTSPTYQQVSWSDNLGHIAVKFPAFYAKCDTSRFTTQRKEQVDSANTNYYLSLELYRVPHGNGLMSYWVSEVASILNAT